MKTVTISMRLPRSEVGRLEKLARELGTERPAFLKRALQRGAADLMFERACQAYRDGEMGPMGVRYESQMTDDQIIEAWVKDAYLRDIAARAAQGE